MEGFNKPGAATPGIGHTRDGAVQDNIHINGTPYQTPIKPKSQRELRGLRALVDNPGGVYRHDMDVAIGAQNSPEYVSRLRQSGWGITTDRVPMIDRDGRKIRVGRYRLASSQRDTAIAALGS